MKNTYLLCLLIPCSFHVNAQLDSLNSPAVWLRADQSELTPTGWKDTGLFNYHAQSASPQETPTLTGTINFNKALVFDGIDDYFKIPYSLDVLANLSVLAVFQSADTTERGIWGTEEGSSRNILLTTRKAIGPDTIADSYGRNEKITVLNSVLQNWEKTTATSSSQFFALGSAGKLNGYADFKGCLAELIVFNHALPFLERVKYETYLAIKYGTGLKAGNFVSSDNKVLWHFEKNKTYGKNIAGIGRDDGFRLYQKQSGSAYDSGLVVISAGTLANSNLENVATFNDQHYLLWGDNGLPLRAKRGDGIDSVLSVVQRKWLVTATGQTASTIPVEVYVDATRLPMDPLGYWLVIDRSGKGNFSVDNLEYVLPDRIANGKIVYKNILWDNDGSGTDNFSFAQANELFAVIRKIADPSCTDETAGKVSIEIIAGRAPFQYSLSDAEATIAREWKQTQTSVQQDELVPGVYTLTIKDNDQEVIRRRFSMLMPDGLNIDLGPDRNLATNPDITLDVSQQIPDSIEVSYRWENNFGFNSNETKININESGIYRVFVTKQKDGCVFRDEVTISGGEERIAVYPNILHASDSYNVSIALEEAGPVSVKVFNSLGIMTYGMHGRDRSQYQFNSMLKDTGMYLVVIQTPKGIETRKLILQ